MQRLIKPLAKAGSCIIALLPFPQRSIDYLPPARGSTVFFDRNCSFALAILLKSGITCANQGRKRRFLLRMEWVGGEEALRVANL
jgi:hypothetical protein